MTLTHIGMTPLLLHKILPPGGFGVGFIFFALVLLVIPMLAKGLAILGALAIAGAGRERLGPLLTHDARRPSLGLVLAVLVACSAAAMTVGADATNLVSMLVLRPGSMIAMIVGGDSPTRALVVSAVVATAYWVLVVTGLRFVVPMVRGLRTAKLPPGTA